MIGVAVIGEGIPDRPNILITILVILFGSIFLGGMFTLIETKYIPFRKIKLKKKYKTIFSAEEISDNLFKFRYEGFDVFLNLNFQLKMFQIGGYLERIEFHLVRAQVDDLEDSFWIKLKESNIGSIETYRVYETNNRGVKLGWKRIQKQLAKIKRVKY